MSMSPRLLRPRQTGFDPRNISGLAGWWDAADSATLLNASGTAAADDENVATWNDKSGLSRHMTQTTDANRPQRKAASINNKDSLYFDGADFNASVSFSLTQPYTCFLVARATAYSGFQTVLLRPNISRNGNGAGYLFAGGVLSAVIVSGVNVFWPNNSVQAHAYIVNGASSAIRINGSLNASGNAGTTNLANGAAIGASSTSYVGNICEFCLYGSLLSGASISSIEKYLGSKWGIAIP